MTTPGTASADPIIVSTLTEAEIAAAIAAGQEAAAEEAVGLTDPTLAFNLSGINDYSVALPFLDLAKSMRAWIGHLPGQWGGMSYSELVSGGYIDENGWPTAIPDGLESIGTLWAWSTGMTENPEDFAGRYVLTYEGEGTISVRGDARVISNEPGRIVFENMNGGTIQVRITETDPDDTGEHIRNISLVPEDKLALYEAGAIFNPDWLALIEDARVLRFMDWGKTNNATIVSWDQRNTPEAAGIGQGAPVEYMVALANEIGADPWFTMPHLADENYVREFATYVRDNLDPSLVARVEYSNEAWNFSFQQAKWLNEQSMAEWGVESFHNYYVKMAVRNALIWEEVFGEEADARLVNVLGSQTANAWLSEQMLSASVWKANEPDAWVDPVSIFDELAITTYFGSQTVSNAALRAELIAQVNDPNVDAFAWLYDKLMDPAYAWSIPYVTERMQAQAAIAENYGLDLVAYEGGQHVHHSFAVSGLSANDIETLTEFLGEFVRSEEMALLYQEIWDVWAEISDGPFMQFTEASQPGRSGSWGLYSGLSDTNPRAALLEALNAGTEPWWDGAEGGLRYQQGVTLFAGDEGEILIGTARHDYLIGGAGDDIFIPGAGNDGINGGDGTDRVVLSGALSAYEIAAEGAGYRLIGPDGSKFLINVENLTFDDVALIGVTEMLGQLPGLPGMPEPGAEPQPGTEDEDLGDAGPVAAPIAIAGTLIDGALIDGAQEGVAIAAASDGVGAIIYGINRVSLLGKELELRNSDMASYVIHAKGATFDAEDRTFGAYYWTLQENRAADGGALLTGSAVETALLLGSVAARVGAVHGTDGNDEFHGRGDDDIFHGGAGNDQIWGAAGNDSLYGGAGNDRIWGGAGDDFIDGGAGNDILYGGAGNDILAPGTGNDQIYGGSGFDRLLLEGRPEDYTLHAEGDGYRLSGVHGSKFAMEIDEFAFFTPGDAADGAPGGASAMMIVADNVFSLEELLEFSVSASDDTTQLAGRGEWIDSTPGGIAITDLPETAGGAIINGINTSSALGRELGISTANEYGSYVIHSKGTAAQMDDRSVGASYWTLQENRDGDGGALLTGSALETALLLGSVATHTGAVHGTDGNDEFHGRTQDDTFYGGAGNDLLYGGAGNDILYGGAGNDRIWGGAGDDVIVGGTGNDILYGGAGNDTFRFSAGDGNDTIGDFAPGDRLDLANYLLPGQSISHGEDVSGRLLLSNGSDSIAFTGLTMNDLAWIDGMA